MPFLRSSVAKKAAMAVTGFILFGFVVVHMLGNLQVFLGQDTLNAYAKKLQDLTHLLWLARGFLLASLVVHVAVAARLTWENRRARPQAYAAKKFVQASYASRTMWMTGVITFLFTVYHLLHFTFGVTNPEYYHLTDARGRHDVYSMVILSFRDPWISGAYVLAMAALCLHLSHGVSSAFQSLGLNRTRYNWFTGRVGNVAAMLIFAGNVSIPAAAFFGWLTLPPGVVHGA
jgi:succinate dehydrogenase / fumarate reductase cytochrome b subunit